MIHYQKSDLFDPVDFQDLPLEERQARVRICQGIQRSPGYEGSQTLKDLAIAYVLDNQDPEFGRKHEKYAGIPRALAEAAARNIQANVWAAVLEGLGYPREWNGHGGNSNTTARGLN